MVNASEMGKGLTQGMKILIAIMLALGTLAVTSIITLLIVGVLGNTATSGNIPVSDDINTSIASVETAVTTSTTSVLANLPLIIGLVALVVVLAVIGWMVFSKKGNSSDGVDF